MSGVVALREENATLARELAELEATFVTRKSELREEVAAVVAEFKASKSKAEKLKEENEGLLVQLEAEDERRFAALSVSSDEHVRPPHTPTYAHIHHILPHTPHTTIHSPHTTLLTTPLTTTIHTPPPPTHH